MSNEDFQAVDIKMLQQAIINTLDTNKKVESVKKKHRKFKDGNDGSNSIPLSGEKGSRTEL